MPLLTNEALEEIVAEEPYDDDGWSVLEDWLLEQDDPRAEILRSPEPATAREGLLPVLLGPDHGELPAKGFEWRGGYVTDAIFYAEDCQRLFELFAKAPAVTLLRTLSIATGLPELRGVFAALATVPFARSLRLLQLTSDESGVLPAAVLDSLVRLDTLMLGRVVLDTTDAAVFAHVGTLSIAPGARPEKELVGFLCARPLPALRTLRLDFRNLEANVRVPIDERPDSAASRAQARRHRVRAEGVIGIRNRVSPFREAVAAGRRAEISQPAVLVDEERLEVRRLVGELALVVDDGHLLELAGRWIEAGRGRDVDQEHARR